MAGLGILLPCRQGGRKQSSFSLSVQLRVPLRESQCQMLSGWAIAEVNVVFRRRNFVLRSVISTKSFQTCRSDELRFAVPRFEVVRRRDLIPNDKTVMYHWFVVLIETISQVRDPCLTKLKTRRIACSKCTISTSRALHNTKNSRIPHCRLTAHSSVTIAACVHI